MEYSYHNVFNARSIIVENVLVNLYDGLLKMICLIAFFPTHSMKNDGIITIIAIIINDTFKCWL